MRKVPPNGLKRHCGPMSGAVGTADPPKPVRLPSESPCLTGARTVESISVSALERLWPIATSSSARAVAIYLEITSLKSISSLKLSRDIGVRQPTAWFMLHRIREAWTRNGNGTPFSGPVEVDEAYMGGKRRNMSNRKRKELSGRGPVGKTSVAGMKDRDSNRVEAKVVANTKSETMSRFIMEHVVRYEDLHG